LHEAHRSKELLHLGVNIRVFQSLLYTSMIAYSISYKVPVHMSERTQHGNRGLETGTPDLQTHRTQNVTTVHGTKKYGKEILV
jgi:hypothetical protein